MGLKYPPEWKFDGIGESISPEAISAIYDLVLLTASGADDVKRVLERFKSAFGLSAPSSNLHFAEVDLREALRTSAENAARFVDALWSGMESVKNQVGVPSAQHTILARHSVPLRIEPPHMVLVRGDIAVVDSLDDDEGGIGRELIYLRGEEIGRGGFGVVYKVTRTTAIGTYEFAMKVHEPHVFNQKPEIAAERFKREMEVLKRLQHRAIIHHFEAGIDADSKPYILMPRIEGPNLRDALSGQGLEKVCDAFREILLALKYAHSLNVIHRDLKPTNVLVRLSDQQPIILDFGSAYMLDKAESTDFTTTLIGSAPYIPIEVLSNPKLRSPLQDIYACGVMLYEVVAGALPEVGNYQPLETINSEFAVLDPLVCEAIASAKKRLPDAATFLSRLAEVA